MSLPGKEVGFVNEVWSPKMRSGPRMGIWTQIEDWILSGSSEPKNGSLDRGIVVWDPDVGLSPRWKSRSWNGGLGPEIDVLALDGCLDPG